MQNSIVCWKLTRIETYCLSTKMDADQIQKILQQEPWTKHCFVGVFAADTLPTQRIQPPCCLVVNTDPADKPGSHWIAIYIDRDGCGEYFDSYGMAPCFPQFLDRHAYSGWKWNTRQVQCTVSSLCGAFCILFLTQRCAEKRRRCNGDTMERTIQKSFPFKDLWRNDIAVQRQLYRKYGLFIPFTDVKFIVNQLKQM